MSTDSLSPPRPGPAEPPNPRTSAWSLLSPLLLRMHFYAGVLVAPFIVVATLTGLAYVYTPQIEDRIYADHLYVEEGTEPLPLGAQIAAAAEARPEGTVVAVQPAVDPDRSTRVLLDTPDVEGSYRLGVFVDPYTGEVLGELTSYGSSNALPVRSWVSEFHRNLHLGDVGRIYSELAASWLWVVAVGGLALWIGRRRRSHACAVPCSPRPGDRATAGPCPGTDRWASGPSRESSPCRRPA